jgi:hypothetical protein
MTDPQNISILRDGRWYPHRRSDRTVYVIGTIDGEQTRLHRLVLPGHKEVDHKDGNGLNNRGSNLRPATRTLNLANVQKRKKKCASSYKGVSFAGAHLGRPWRAQVCKEGLSRNLGYHSTQEDAALAYDAGAKELFGEYARLNFPTGEH